MKTKLTMFSLTALLLLCGLVSCGTEEDVFEAGLVNDTDDTAISVPEEGDEYQTVSTGNFHMSRNPANVQRWTMVATGQDECYGVDGKIPCPYFGSTFYGQDATYQMGVRSYVDNGDATVTDSVTGLIWQRGYKSDLTWYEAKSYCDNLSLASHPWRLPLTHELKSLIDYGASNPAIDTTAFPDTPSDWFWATKHSGFNDVSSGLDASWIINFFDGFVEYTSRSNLYNVRCIRAD